MTFSSSALFVSFGVKNAPWVRRMAILSVAFLYVFYKAILIGGAVPPHTVTRLGIDPLLLWPRFFTEKDTRTDENMMRASI